MPIRAVYVPPPCVLQVFCVHRVATQSPHINCSGVCVYPTEILFQSFAKKEYKKNVFIKSSWFVIRGARKGLVDLYTPSLFIAF